MSLQRISEDMLDKKFVDRVNNLESQLAETTDELIRRGANVESFGAIGNGEVNDTHAFENAQILNDVIVLGQGKTYRLQNFVPRKGLTIVANGAIIMPYDNTTYEDTETSASIIVSNEDLQIFGGVWKGSLDSQTTYSGSICVESGSLKIIGATIDGGWGGIFGHRVQNKNRMAEHVSLINCTIKNCVHNTWFSDIKNLVISGCQITKSKGDGVRTFRNVLNVSISGSHIYENGDPNNTNSKDGIDLFIAGKRCSIIGNFIYGNLSEGIDIKRYPDGDGQSVLDEEYIISGNFIFGNRLCGFKTSSPDDTRGYIKNLTLSDNHIYENGDYGIVIEYTDIFNIHDNQIYNNGNVGIRVSKTVDGGVVHHNIVYNNCLNIDSGARTGILINSSALNVDVTDNKLFMGGDSQVEGISFNGNGTCKDNNSSGHFRNITGGFNGTGDIVEVDVNHFGFFVAKKDCMLNKITFASSAQGEFLLEIIKRNSDGSSAGVIFNKNVNIPAQRATVDVDISSLSNALRYFEKDQILTIRLPGSPETYGACFIDVIS